eukprot:m.137285 g.137285  ORF g.137285 m.137285 type:complete len:55 (+) comp16992_c0_seq4:407-571(+)
MSDSLIATAGNTAAALVLQVSGCSCAKPACPHLQEGGDAGSVVWCVRVGLSICV